jgi:hypothetical protein
MPSATNQEPLAVGLSKTQELIPRAPLFGLTAKGFSYYTPGS